MNFLETIATTTVTLANFGLTIALPEIARWVVFSAIVWVPVVIFEFAWHLWVRYVRTLWISKQDKILLEIKLPQETFKSPHAMEMVLLALYQTGGESTPLNRYWEGKVRVWYSLELVSIGGEVHFYIWTFKNQKNTIESSIYAQYPDVEVHEVKDYTHDILFDAEKHDLWGTRLEATGPDPLPIKTYVDYKLDKDPKEEYKVDPISAVIEQLGTIKPGHQAWIQIVIRAHTQEKTPLNEKYPDKWKDEAKELIEAEMELASTEDAEGKKVPNSAKLSDWQREKIEAIERSVSKYAFDAGIRIVYIAPKAEFDKGGGGGVMGSMKAFNAPHLNGFKPSGTTGFDYKWQDFSGKKLLGMKKGIFRAYCDRGYFHYPYKEHFTILNTEELATMFHFPGSAVRTPNLKRIPSKRADAPANLPI